MARRIIICVSVAVVFLSAVLAVCPSALARLPQKPISPRTETAFLDDWNRLEALDVNANHRTFIVIDISRQQLYLFKDDKLADTWPVSTARRGAGEREGSLKTPLGVFEIVQKIGAGLPEFAVLNRHGPTGGVALPIFSSNDPDASHVIVARIIALQGLEPGWNEGGDVDTFTRHIYIHGTADVGQLGTAVSEGCIQMAPGAVIQLFHTVHPGTLVLITRGNKSLNKIPGEVIATASNPVG